MPTAAQMTTKLKGLIPRQRFGARCRSRHRIRKSLPAKHRDRKDVLSKCYGGDITRKA